MRGMFSADEFILYHAYAAPSGAMFVVTLTLATPVIPLLLATTENGPPIVLLAVNNPFESIVPPPVVDHVNGGCGSKATPKASIAKAVNGKLSPGAIIASPGVTWMSTSGPITSTCTFVEI